MRATKNAEWQSLQVDSHLLHLIEKNYVLTIGRS